MIVVAVMMAGGAVAQEVVKLPDEVAQKAKCLNPEFLFYRPKGVDAARKAPLLIHLHGMAWRGRDIRLIQKVSRWGLSANAEKHNLLLVMPQCDTDAKGENKGEGRWKAEDVKLLLEYVKGAYEIDENRIYLTGYSMGGFGTRATAIAYPNTFAAISPVAGGGDPQQAGAIKHLPVWVFHGQKDTVVPHKRSADMVEALQKQGNKKVKFTSYPDERHNRVMGMAINHAELYEWLLAQERLTPATTFNQ